MTTATWQRWNHVIQKIWLFVLVIMLLTAPRHLFFVSCSLALFSNTIPYFDVISLYLYFSFSHYYYYFVSPKWNIFITNITFIILAWLHTPQHSQLCSLSTTLSPGFLSSSFTIYWVCLSVAPQQPRHQVVLFIFSLFFNLCCGCAYVHASFLFKFLVIPFFVDLFTFVSSFYLDTNNMNTFLFLFL